MPADPVPPPDASSPPASSSSGAESYRMQLGEAAEEEAREFEGRRGRERLRRLRRWLSSLFILASLSLLLYLAGVVVALLSGPDVVVLMLIVAFLPGALACWLLGIVCAARLREWRWVVGLGLGPLVVILVAGLFTLPALFVYPLGPIAGGLAYPWSKGRDLFD